MNTVQKFRPLYGEGAAACSSPKAVSQRSRDIPARILLVEDDAEMARLLGETIEENGFTPHIAMCAAEMDIQLQERNIDLVILDVMLPGENGISICHRLRTASDMPIIMLTALDEDLNRILALELGADDYVTKPFNSRELIARIRTILRRTGSAGVNAETRPRMFRFASWRLSIAQRELFNPEGARVATTSAEFDLIVAFCLNPGRILSRDQLLDLTHSGAAGPVDRTIDVHISRIRQKIEPDPREPTMIKTVRLGGYQFTPLVYAT